MFSFLKSKKAPKPATKHDFSKDAEKNGFHICDLSEFSVAGGVITLRIRLQTLTDAYTQLALKNRLKSSGKRLKTEHFAGVCNIFNDLKRNETL